MNRRPLLLGRSMEKYVGTAEKMGYIELPDNVGLFGNRRSVDKMLRKIMQDGKEKYLLIITGHQGEPESMLTRVASGATPFEITSGDKVVFSAEVIPTPINAAHRYLSRRSLK